MARTIAIVVAAGSGTRLGAGVPKAFALLEGRSLVERALDGLAASGVVDAAVVAVPAGRTDEFTLILGGTRLDGTDFPVTVVAGGAERSDSVRNALAAVGDADYVLVHDAARPLTPPAVIARVVAALVDGHPAVIPAIPLVDTVKAVDANGTVLGTPERSGLRAVQTPQGFRTEVLCRANDRAVGRVFTDDAAVVEHIGTPVHTVDGDQLAFKITTPLDLLTARAVLAETGPEGAGR